MNLRSHKLEEILEAFEKGYPVWVLDTGKHDSDDVLIGAKDIVRLNIFQHFKIDAFPTSWAMKTVTRDEFEQAYRL